KRTNAMLAGINDASHTAMLNPRSRRATFSGYLSVPYRMLGCHAIDGCFHYAPQRHPGVYLIARISSRRMALYGGLMG
ncbi:hypothetical protein, partial [Bradyrhizobium sp. CCBAU 45384]|uniref:hypothetical protein n=1 Tax=Bradyrhizobium sp. CCBAU 45384 TaxID=858428 RepID=UPI002306B34B